MSDETITRQVSERYARAVTSGEQMCCPTGYNFDDLRSFVPEEVLRVSYGCGTPAGLATVRIDRERDSGEYWEPNIWIIHEARGGTQG